MSAFKRERELVPVKTMSPPTRKPRRDGEMRRLRVVLFLRDNPGSSHLAIARGVGLATHHSYSPTLDRYLSVLEAEGRVRQGGRKWEATA